MPLTTAATQVTSRPQVIYVVNNPNAKQGNNSQSQDNQKQQGQGQEQGDVAGRFGNNGYNNRPGGYRPTTPNRPSVVPGKLPAVPGTSRYKDRSPASGNYKFNPVISNPIKTAIPAGSSNFYQGTVGTSFAQKRFTIPTDVGGKVVNVEYNVQSSGARTPDASASFARNVWEQNQADWNPPGKQATIYRARDPEGALLKDRVTLFDTVRAMQTITATGTVDNKKFVATIAYKIGFDPSTQQRYFYIGLQSGGGAPGSVVANQYRLLINIARENGFTEIRTIRDRPGTNRQDRMQFNAETYRQVGTGKDTVYFNKIKLYGNPKMDALMN